MKHLKALHPQYWTSKFYYGVAGVLLAINLFGPKGIIHWVLIRQESERLEATKTQIQSELARTKNEIQQFRKSDVARARAIREELGFLKPGEVSVELLDRSDSEEHAR